MAFFDTTQDLGLLDSDLRADPDLSVKAATVETEVLLRFTVDEGDSTTVDHVVYLKGYDDDTPADSNAILKDALKRAIARVLNHRLRNKTAATQVQRIKLADWEMERSGDGVFDPRWPEAWDAELVRFFDERVPWYHI